LLEVKVYEFCNCTERKSGQKGKKKVGSRGEERQQFIY